MFDVYIEFFVDAVPQDAVSQSLAHLDDIWESFMRELKNLLAEVRRDDLWPYRKRIPYATLNSSASLF